MYWYGNIDIFFLGFSFTSQSKDKRIERVSCLSLTSVSWEIDLPFKSCTHVDQITKILIQKDCSLWQGDYIFMVVFVKLNVQVKIFSKIKNGLLYHCHHTHIYLYIYIMVRKEYISVHFNTFFWDIIYQCNIVTCVIYICDVKKVCMWYYLSFCRTFIVHTLYFTLWRNVNGSHSEMM